MAIKREKAYRLTKVKLCFCVDGMIAYALNHREYADDYSKVDKQIPLENRMPVRFLYTSNNTYWRIK